MAKFIALTLLGAIAIIMGITVMMYGWGLTPVSWWWIIGVGVFGRVILAVIEELCKK